MEIVKLNPENLEPDIVNGVDYSRIEVNGSIIYELVPQVALPLPDPAPPGV